MDIVKNKELAVMSAESFHKGIHTDIGSPSKKYIKIGHGKSYRRKAVSKEHQCEWADSSINLKQKTVNITLYINFQKNALNDQDYLRLKNLAGMGISEYWSRQVSIASEVFTVVVDWVQRENNAIDVDLMINKDSNYERSHNSGIIDASFIYNEGTFGTNKGLANNNFKMTSAHEFGHSVLDYFGGTGLSWGHKGSTNALLQSVKGDTPGYPLKGEVDLMMYYDKLKNTSRVANIYQRTSAVEQDVKRLIWMSNIKFFPIQGDKK